MLREPRCGHAYRQIELYPRIPCPRCIECCRRATARCTLRDRSEVRQTGHDVHISQHARALCALHSVSSTSNIHRSTTAAPSSPGWFSRRVACVCIDWHNRGLTAYIRRLQYCRILKRLSPRARRSEISRKTR